MHASKLANQAAPVTRKYAAGAAVWAKPRVGRVRAWMAVRAARGSISMQQSVAPRISAMLAATAQRLDPPPPQKRRWPKVLAGTALLAAGAAAATAIAVRRRSRRPMPPPPMPPPRQHQPARPAADQRSTVTNPNAETERDRAMAEPNGMSRTR